MARLNNMGLSIAFEGLEQATHVPDAVSDVLSTFWVRLW